MAKSYSKTCKCAPGSSVAVWGHPFVPGNIPYCGICGKSWQLVERHTNGSKGE
jgi:hypothetical protein